MRSLERNQQTIYYVQYSDNTPTLDEDGNDTGETANSYSNPIKLDISVSGSKGKTQENAFGISLDYDKTMSTCDIKVPINEYSKLFIDVMPIIKEDGSTDSKPDYRVKKVAKSINNILYAIKKI